MRWKKNKEIELTYIKVDNEGIVDPAAVASAVRPNTVLVSVMHSNNEVGTVQDIAAIAREARKAHKEVGGSSPLLVHTDAAQSVGKVPVHPAELGADLCTIVGHKFGAPKGVAALYVRNGVACGSLIVGGGQEGGRRAGTEALSQIVAMGAAAKVVNEQADEISSHMAKCRDALYWGLCKSLGEDSLRVNGPPLAAGPAKRLPNTLSLGIKGASASRILKDLSDANVAASASAACHSSDTAKAKVSFVLAAMDVPMEFARGTLRLSVGRHTTLDEISKAVEVITKSCQDSGHTKA